MKGRRPIGIHTLNLILGVIVERSARGVDEQVGRQARDRDGSFVRRHARLRALLVAFVVVHRGVEFDLDLRYWAANGVAFALAVPFDLAAMQVDVALDDVDVGGCVFAVAAILVVLRVVVLAADAVAKFFHLELEIVVFAVRATFLCLTVRRITEEA